MKSIKFTKFLEQRLKAGYRQVDIAEKTGIPQPRWSRIEREVTEPTEDELKKIEKVFNG